jgi:hypothetical protein
MTLLFKNLITQINNVTYYPFTQIMQEAIKRIQRWQQKNDPYTELDLSNLDLEELPDIPANCLKLSCGFNNLSKLPEIPPQCQQLYCQNNKLTKLPKLDNCWYLECSNNLLSELPSLPVCRELYCSNNVLTGLPPLQNCQYLHCNFNKITKLPELVTCIRLYAEKNMITELPTMSNFTVFMSIYGNKYLHISKQIAESWSIMETPNYTKCAIIIQRNYRKYKCTEMLRQYLYKGPANIVIRLINLWNI